MTVVFVMTVEEAVFRTSVLSRDVVLENSNTFLGALSNGRRYVLTPLSGSSSTKTPSCSIFPLLLVSELLLPDVKLDNEETFVGPVDPDDDISQATRAARTSGLKEPHASKIELGNRGLGKAEASSL